jgi:hypothetical protein
VKTSLLNALKTAAAVLVVCVMCWIVVDGTTPTKPERPVTEMSAEPWGFDKIPTNPREAPPPSKPPADPDADEGNYCPTPPICANLYADGKVDNTADGPQLRTRIMTLAPGVHRPVPYLGLPGGPVIVNDQAQFDCTAAYTLPDNVDRIVWYAAYVVYAIQPDSTKQVAVKIPLSPGHMHYSIHPDGSWDLLSGDDRTIHIDFNAIAFRGIAVYGTYIKKIPGVAREDWVEHGDQDTGIPVDQDRPLLPN